MYFPGEALNEKDPLISTMPARRRDPALTTCKSVESREPGNFEIRVGHRIAASISAERQSRSMAVVLRAHQNGRLAEGRRKI
jgi:protocatechuate 3,4-dioxygenase beta subunit